MRTCKLVPATVDYTVRTTPPGYVCGKCQREGVKLWREYSMFLNHQTLVCASCLLEEGQENSERPKFIGQDGKVGDGRMRSDGAGWRIPAIPTQQNDTFWGYSSVPEDGVLWWRRLPLRKGLEEISTYRWECENRAWSFYTNGILRATVVVSPGYFNAGAVDGYEILRDGYDLESIEPSLNKARREVENMYLPYQE